MANQRPIRTVFYRGKQEVRVNYSTWANNAVPNAVRHMQTNEYDATHCEVFDSVNGELHSVIKRRITGDIEILFKREVKEGM